MFKAFDTIASVLFRIFVDLFFSLWVILPIFVFFFDLCFRSVIVPVFKLTRFFTSFRIRDREQNANDEAKRYEFHNSILAV